MFRKTKTFTCPCTVSLFINFRYIDALVCLYLKGCIESDDIRRIQVICFTTNISHGLIKSLFVWPFQKDKTNQIKRLFTYEPNCFSAKGIHMKY